MGFDNAGVKAELNEHKVLCCDVVKCTVGVLFSLQTGGSILLNMFTGSSSVLFEFWILDLFTSS